MKFTLTPAGVPYSRLSVTQEPEPVIVPDNGGIAMGIGGQVVNAFPVTYYLSVHNSHSNCKLAYVESSGSALTLPRNDAELTQLIDEIKKIAPNRNLLFTVTHESLFDKLKKFPHYYAVIVPVGYGTGNQYHVLLKNHPDQRAPIESTKIVEKIVEKVVEKPIDREKLMKGIQEAFETTQNRKKRLALIKEHLDKS